MGLDEQITNKYIPSAVLSYTSELEEITREVMRDLATEQMISSKDYNFHNTMMEASIRNELDSHIVMGINWYENRKYIYLCAAWETLIQESMSIYFGEKENPYEELAEQYEESVLREVVIMHDLYFRLMENIAYQAAGIDTVLTQVLGLFILSTNDDKLRDKFLRIYINRNTLNNKITKANINLKTNKINIDLSVAKGDFEDVLSLAGATSIYMYLMDMDDIPHAYRKNTDIKTDFIMRGMLEIIGSVNKIYMFIMNGKIVENGEAQEVPFLEFYKCLVNKENTLEDVEEIIDIKTKAMDSPYLQNEAFLSLIGLDTRDLPGLYGFMDMNDEYWSAFYYEHIMVKSSKNQEFQKVYRKINEPLYAILYFVNMYKRQQMNMQKSMSDAYVCTKLEKQEAKENSYKEKIATLEEQLREEQSKVKELTEAKKSIPVPQSNEESIKLYQHENEKKSKQIEQLQEEVEKQRQELAALRSFVYHMDDAIEEKVPESIIDELKQTKVVCVGGHTNLHAKIKNEFPKWQCIEIKQLNVDENIIRNADLIIIFNRYITHNLYYSAMDIIREHKIDMMYSTANNIERLVAEITQHYKEVR